MKHQVIKKLYHNYPEYLQCKYLTGPDRKRVWLCDDCRESANLAGFTYVEYIRKEQYCPKCFLQSVEKEYYSLIEFCFYSDRHRFTFHLPLYSVRNWLTEIGSLPQGSRDLNRSTGPMYLYGRNISRIEEQAFPLTMVTEQLNAYINKE